MLFEEKEGIPMKRLQEMSFRYKLMAFVFLLCIVIIGTVYVLSVVMLEPAYNSRVRQDLSATLDTLTDIVDEASEQGSLISYYWRGQPYVREDFRDLLNPGSLTVLNGCRVEAYLADAKPGDKFQFLKSGYFCVDPDSTPGRPVFNRTVSLKDSWAKK